MKFLVVALCVLGSIALSAAQLDFRGNARSFAPPQALNQHIGSLPLAANSRQPSIPLPAQLNALPKVPSANLIADAHSASSSEAFGNSARHYEHGHGHGPDPKDTKLVKYIYENFGEEGYFFEFELSDGQTRWEYGTFKDGGIDEHGEPIKILVVHGYYSHVAPDGQTYWVEFEADEGGYRPKFGVGIRDVPQAKRPANHHK